MGISQYDFDLEDHLYAIKIVLTNEEHRLIIINKGDKKLDVFVGQPLKILINVFKP